MPIAQPQDVDKLFYSTMNVTWQFNGAAALSQPTVFTPSQVQFTRTGVGLYLLSLPASYMTALTNANTPIVAVSFLAQISSGTAGGTDAGYRIRYLPSALNTSLSLGTFAFATDQYNNSTPALGTPVDPTSAFFGSLLGQLKFQNTVIYPS